MATDVDEIIIASMTGDSARVAALLDKDPALINAMTMLGATPIHAAHYSGWDDVVALLLSHGRALDVYLAAELGLVDTLQAMLDDDPALTMAVSASGSTPLHGACYWGAGDAARLLLERGADPDLATTDSFLQIRALGCAVASPGVPNPSEDEAAVLELVDLLLDHGADPNGRRRDGMTAIHTAAYRGHLKVIQRLVERGADPAIRAHSDGGHHAGESPADTAVKQGQAEAADLLQRLADAVARTS
jgi:ankyrin repeat protein